MSLIGQANEDRNNLLHGSWDGYSRGSDLFHKAKRYTLQNGGLNFIPVVNISRTLIQETGDFIAYTTHAVHEWTTRFRLSIAEQPF
jgi:hypothetical protein